MKDYSEANKQAAKVVYIYLVISGVWILAGDHLTALVPEKLHYARLFSGYESWFVVLIAAGFIYFPVRSGYRALIQSSERHLNKAGHSLKRDLTALARLIDVRHINELSHSGSKAALRTTRSRIRILSRIYDLLLKNENGHVIPFQQVAGHMKTNSFNGLDMHCDELYLPVSQAVPLALLLNETISPFVPDTQGEEFPLTVAIKNTPKSVISVTFRLTDAPDYYYLISQIRDKDNHQEAKLIDSFTKKLRGVSSWKETSGHLTYQVQFKK